MVQARITKEKISQFMLENYELDIDVDEMFGSFSDSGTSQLQSRPHGPLCV